VENPIDLCQQGLEGHVNQVSFNERERIPGAWTFQIVFFD
jgi:hypothetical protein